MSISVLIMVVYSATSLLVSAIRINGENVNTIIAYGLAQEGLEAIRNIRDSNWLLGLDFKKGGVIPSGDGAVTLWGEKLPVDSSAPVYFLLDYQNIDQMFFTVNDDYSIAAENAPWTLQALNTGGIKRTEEDLLSSEQTMLYKSAANGRDVIYSTDKTVDAVDTGLHRLIKVELLDHKDLQKKKYRVSSIVAWPAGNGMHKVVLTTELTDWKEGII